MILSVDPIPAAVATGLLSELFAGDAKPMSHHDTNIYSDDDSTTKEA